MTYGEDEVDTLVERHRARTEAAERARDRARAQRWLWLAVGALVAGVVVWVA